MARQLFTSESVSMGHPDKMCDQISDAVLDAMLEQDPMSRVACETLTTTGMVLLAGEVTTKAEVEFPALVRDVVRFIGYTSSEMGFDADTCAVQVALGKQSPDISQGVTEGEGLHKEQGAGDQGMMFGYACDETPELMPAPIRLAHRLIERHRELFETNKLPYLRPDAKSQVTVEYAGDKPVRISAVVLSTQHDPDVAYDKLRVDVIEQLIRAALPANWIDDKTVFHVNPTGRFVVGGPMGDAGLTGRKIIVDTYGGMAGTAAARSRARIRPRSTAARPTRRAGWPRTSWRRASLGAPRCSSPTRSAWPTRSRSASTRSAPRRTTSTASRSSCASTSTSPRAGSSRRSIYGARSTAPPPITVTSGARTRASPGRRRRARRRCAARRRAERVPSAQRRKLR